MQAPEGDQNASNSYIVRMFSHFLNIEVLINLADMHLSYRGTVLAWPF